MEGLFFNITMYSSDIYISLCCQQLQNHCFYLINSSHVNVTLWDNTAKKLYEKLQQPLEEPVIIILASAKVGKWKGANYTMILKNNSQNSSTLIIFIRCLNLFAEEVDMSHIAATHFYLNWNHHTVKKIRKI